VHSPEDCPQQPEPKHLIKFGETVAKRLKNQFESKLIFSSRLAATNHSASPSHDVTMMRDGCSDPITRSKAYHHADSKNGKNELYYLRISHSQF